ncbi:MAG: 5-formyltetrahydrofolate cyclo-ligase [Firmicutes bacterium]|nr:5-formyltetrahydrofolate cyclo-ligase [Bacillota bacterium]
MDILTAKKKIRGIIQADFQTMDDEKRHQWDLKIRKVFLTLDPVLHSRRIMIYYSIRREVETHWIIGELLNLGKEVALPICTAVRDLEAGWIRDLSELAPARNTGAQLSKAGLWEPRPGVPLMAPESIDLIVTPGVAFDERGFRLGHGAGYYDRFLPKASQAHKLGLAYDFQVVKELPVEPHDVPLDSLLTPTRFLKFR